MIWFCAAEKKSRFPFALNEVPNKCGRLATDFVRHFFNFDTYEGNDLRQVKSLNEDKILFERLSLAYFHGTKTAFEKCGGRNSFSLVAGFAFDGFIDSGEHPGFTKKIKNQ